MLCPITINYTKMLCRIALANWFKLVNSKACHTYNDTAGKPENFIVNPQMKLYKLKCIEIVISLYRPILKEFSVFHYFPAGI